MAKGRKAKQERARRLRNKGLSKTAANRIAGVKRTKAGK